MKLNRRYERLKEKFESNPDAVVEYIFEALNRSALESDYTYLYASLGTVVKCTEGFSSMSESLEKTRNSLYKSLSEDGNPSADLILKLLDHYGIFDSLYSLNKAYMNSPSVEAHGAVSSRAPVIICGESAADYNPSDEFLYDMAA